uniref:Uncharacterized protein n=1 Tax=Cannabis sativa TaxID=3483 RepID=A0A803QM93_CANSA
MHTIRPLDMLAPAAPRHACCNNHYTCTPSNHSACMLQQPLDMHTIRPLSMHIIRPLDMHVRACYSAKTPCNQHMVNLYKCWRRSCLKKNQKDKASMQMSTYQGTTTPHATPERGERRVVDASHLQALMSKEEEKPKPRTFNTKSTHMSMGSYTDSTLKGEGGMGPSQVKDPMGHSRQLEPTHRNKIALGEVSHNLMKRLHPNGLVQMSTLPMAPFQKQSKRKSFSFNLGGKSHVDETRGVPLAALCKSQKGPKFHLLTLEKG